MEAGVFIINGKKAHLQEAYKSIGRHIGIGKATIYKLGSRYRMMVVCFLSPDSLSKILNNSSLKIISK